MVKIVRNLSRNLLRSMVASNQYLIWKKTSNNHDLSAIYFFFKLCVLKFAEKSQCYWRIPPLENQTVLILSLNRNCRVFLWKDRYWRQVFREYGAAYIPKFHSCRQQECATYKAHRDVTMTFHDVLLSHWSSSSWTSSWRELTEVYGIGFQLSRGSTSTSIARDVNFSSVF